MLRVGLTGGLGSGKSTVGAMFRALGAHTMDADAVGRDLMRPGQQVYREIVARFGPSVVRTGGAQAGELDRAELARLAFACGRLEELNSIVHPAVIAAQAAWMDDLAAREPGAVAIIESALIFETKHGGASTRGAESEASGSGWSKRFDRIVLVVAPEALRIERFVARASGGRTLSAAERMALEADARRRMAAQFPDERKIPCSHFVIENAASVAETQAIVGRVYESLRKSAAE